MRAAESVRRSELFSATSADAFVVITHRLSRILSSQIANWHCSVQRIWNKLLESLSELMLNGAVMEQFRHVFCEIRI